MQPTFSYIYSIPYIILFFIYFLLFLWENKMRKKNMNIKTIRYFSMFIFVVFFGCRGYIDTDFSVYFPLYENAPTLFDANGIAKYFSDINKDFITRIEPGFKVFIIVLKTISSEYFLLQFVSSLIDIIVLDYIFRKYSPQYILSFIIFFIFSGFVIELNLMRNIKSILLFIISLKYIQERNAVKFFTLNGLGLLFHSSSIFYFPMYFFLHKKIPSAFVWIMFIIGNAIYLAQIKFITPIVVSLGSLFGGTYSLMADAYSKSELYSTSHGITLGFIERFLTFVIFYRSYNKIGELIKDKYLLNIFYNSFFLYSVSYLFLSEYSIFIDRLTTLFVFSYWILYSYFYATLSVRIKSLFTIGLFFFGTFKMAKANNIIIRKYENILWDNPNISNAYVILSKHLDKILNPK